jgi:hypothetical protein
MMVVVVKRLVNANQMHHRRDHDENMEQLVRRTEYVQLAGETALGKLGLVIAKCQRW